jgi:threonine dehydrogenase-like Zn-dependent dehydrogenase
VLPTAWQAVEYAAVPAGGSPAILGMGPIGEMCVRVARQQGIERIFAVERVPHRLARARALGAEVIDLEADDDVVAAVRERSDGRGPDSVIDAVGMEAHGALLEATVQAVTGLLPDAIQALLMEKVGLDRLSALQLAIELVRRGGTISIIGVYGGMADPLPMLTLFDKQIQLRMGQANVKHWVDAILPLLLDESDPLGVDGFATHRLPLEEAPHGYEIFQAKSDGAFKVVLQP